MKSLLWDVTYKCNLRCIHCYNAKELIRCQYDNELDSIEVEKFIRRIKELGFDHIHLLGGEPLLYPRLESLLAVAAYHNITTSINTNGTLLDNKCINMLTKYRVSQITISIDGANRIDNDKIRGNGVFDTVLSNAQKLCNALKESAPNSIVQFATVITNLNIEKIHYLPKVAKSVGVTLLDISALYMQGNAVLNSSMLTISPQDYYKALKRLLAFSAIHDIDLQIDCKSRVLRTIAEQMRLPNNVTATYDSCQAADSMYYMDPSGYIFPCGPLAKSQWSSQFMVNLFDADAEKKLTRFRRQMTHAFIKSEVSNMTCQGCSSNEYCHPCPFRYEEYEFALKLCQISEEATV